MNRIDEQLKRLFQAARLVQEDLAVAAPFGLETRVVAAWRENHGPEFLDSVLLRRALLFAGIIMALSFLPVLNQTTNPFSESLQLADSDSSVQADFAP